MLLSQVYRGPIEGLKRPILADSVSVCLVTVIVLFLVFLGDLSSPIHGFIIELAVDAVLDNPVEAENACS